MHTQHQHSVLGITFTFVCFSVLTIGQPSTLGTSEEFCESASDPGPSPVNRPLLPHPPLRLVQPGEHENYDHEKAIETRRWTQERGTKENDWRRTAERDRAQDPAAHVGYHSDWPQNDRSSGSLLLPDIPVGIMGNKIHQSQIRHYPNRHVRAACQSL